MPPGRPDLYMTPTFGPKSRLPAPNIPMPPGPKRPPSIRERILASMFPANSAMAAMFSPEDLDAARSQGLMALGGALLEGGGPHVGEPNPSLGQSFGRGIAAGNDAFSRALAGAAQLQQMSQQMQGVKDERAKAQQLEAQRRQIAAKYPPKPNETDAQTAQRLQLMLQDFMGAPVPDSEMVGRITQLLTQAGLRRSPNTSVVADLIDPKTGKPAKAVVDEAGNVIRYMPQFEPPKDHTARDQIEFARQSSRMDRIVKGFETKIEKRLEAAQTIGQTLGRIPGAKAGDGAAQVEVLYAFIKALDPTSVVREGEVALAREATPLWSYAKGVVSKVENKSFIVSPDVIASMEQMLIRRLRGYAKYIDTQRQQSIKRAGMSRTDLLGDPNEHFLDAETLIGVPLGPPEQQFTPSAADAAHGHRTPAARALPDLRRRP